MEEGEGGVSGLRPVLWVPGGRVCPFHTFLKPNLPRTDPPLINTIMELAVSPHKKP